MYKALSSWLKLQDDLSYYSTKPKDAASPSRDQLVTDWCFSVWTGGCMLFIYLIRIHLTKLQPRAWWNVILIRIQEILFAQKALLVSNIPVIRQTFHTWNQKMITPVEHLLEIWLCVCFRPNAAAFTQLRRGFEVIAKTLNLVSDISPIIVCSYSSVTSHSIVWSIQDQTK